MGFFRDLKDKIAIGIGALRIAVFGDTRLGESTWDMEIKGYGENIHFCFQPLMRALFGGDAGLKGPILSAVLKKIREYEPCFMWLIGDHGYPKGILDQFLYDTLIVDHYNNLGPNHIMSYLVPGNHDSYGDKEERQFLGKKLFGNKDDGKISFRNFYGAWIYTNAMVVWFDSTVYDVKLGDPEIQERQEQFVHKILRDPRFRGLTKIVVAHAGVFSHGSHGNTHSNDYRKFELNSIRYYADYMICGHDHVLHKVGIFEKVINFFGSKTLRKTTYFTSGAMSKRKPSKKISSPQIGVVEFNNGVMNLLPVELPAGAIDDED